MRLIAESLRCPVEQLLSDEAGDMAAAGNRDLDLELRFAEVALRSGDASVALDRFQVALAAAEQERDAARAWQARWGAARSAEMLGDLEGAISSFETLWATKSSHGRTMVATALSRAYSECGDLARAVDVGETALRDIGDDPALTTLQEQVELASTLVGCYCERGDLTRAHLLAEEVIALAERGGPPQARGAAHWNAAVAAEARGDLRAAGDHVDKALALYGEGENARGLALLRVLRGWLVLRSPQPDVATAERLLTQALVDLRCFGTAIDIAYAETEMARCQLMQGDLVDAMDTATSALVRLRGGPRIESARATLVLGHTLLALGKQDHAVAELRKAAQMLENAGGSRQAASAWSELAEVLVAAGCADDAITAYRRATEAVGIKAPTTPPQVTKGSSVAAQSAP